MSKPQFRNAVLRKSMKLAMAALLCLPLVAFHADNPKPTTAPKPAAKPAAPAKPAGAANYTIDTLLRLRGELPPGSALFCLMGADSFLGIRRWHRAAEIPFAAPLIVASRPGQPLDDLVAALPIGLTMEPAAATVHSGSEAPAAAFGLRAYLLRNPAGDTAPLYLLPGLHIDISASQIREQIQASAGSPGPEPPLLPAAVLGYIRSRGLYL